MDQNTRLDHALFQLTPTRTRCDLIIAAGGVSERLATGLLEPFLSHLKSAKDQISKGGYSITLHPASAHAPWFTKATLQRFVRFVSTPEVLERFVTIEKEIVQIENSIQSSEKNNLVAEGEDGRFKKSSSSSKLKNELAGTNQDGYEENSRVRLQRVLDNRKAMLCKEQAMAYARALVAGFYPESVDDLICFADAFGASRLREACINFLELCKQKNEDKLWMDEIAAMQASAQSVLPYLRTSGIILAGEDDTSSKLNGLVDASISESTASRGSFDISQDNSLPTDGRAQTPMSWPNHLPQYMHNFQGPAFQQMPPYQGYLYPGMQVPPSSYYPGNMQWPPNVEDSHTFLDRDSDYHKSSLKKKKKKHSEVPEHSEEDASTDSSYESDSDDHSRQGKKHSSSEHLRKKKHGKKPSRKVVIRNINYITSNRDGEKGSSTEGSLSNEEEFINGDSLKQQVEEAVESLERRHKSTSGRQKKQHSAKRADKVNGSTNLDSNTRKGNDNWDAFQNLLLRDDESTRDTEKEPMKFQEEHIVNKNFEDGRSNDFNHKQEVTKTRAASNDSFVVTERELDREGQNRVEYFKEWKDTHSSMKKKGGPDEMLFSHRNDESGGYSVSTMSGGGPESSLAKIQKEEDWFIVNHSNTPENEHQNKNFGIFDGASISSSATNGVHVEKNKKDFLADDSFMIQARSSENQYNSQSAAGIRSVSDIVGVTEFANSNQEGSHNNKTETLNSHEPNDLYMVLDRDSAVEQNAAPWSMEMDFENNISLNEANRKVSDVETDKKQQSNGDGTDTKTPGVRNGKVSSKEAKSKALNASLGKNKSDIRSRNKTSPGNRSTNVKSKSDKEEESRKRREELMAQRQKRIAERSASKKTEKETKTSLTSAKKEKNKVYPSSEETKELHKPVLRKSTIERLATARVSQKDSPSQAKSGPTKKPSLKANGVSLQKTDGTVKKKQAPKEVKSSNKKDDVKKTNGAVIHDTNAKAHNEIKGKVLMPVNSSDVQSAKPNNNHIGLENNGELPKTLSEKHESHSISKEEHVLESVDQLHMDPSLPNHDRTFGAKEVSDKLSSLPDDNKPQHITDVITNPAEILSSKPQTVSAANSKVNNEIEESNDVFNKVSDKQSSTPPPSHQVMQEPVYSRKKWNSGEDSSKAAKGFRKLLFFGRKS
ncbi:hypothetical protein RIF29_39167 [Crotalaria pallida]|uniref:COP1-interacting protein 7 n=1 Tax=Crotalaria pallida TaxID=3830 RepID=A0AAN9E360_CROPI